MRAILVLAVVLGVLAACDPCSSVAPVHAQRCGEGDSASCEWLEQHQVSPAGICAAP